MVSGCLLGPSLKIKISPLWGEKIKKQGTIHSKALNLLLGRKRLKGKEIVNISLIYYVENLSWCQRDEGEEKSMEEERKRRNSQQEGGEGKVVTGG